MDAIGADHFHMLANVAGVGHTHAPVVGYVTAERPVCRSDARPAEVIR
jgi:hypothetical protein